MLHSEGFAFLNRSMARVRGSQILQVWAAVGFFLGLLIVRLLCAEWFYFFEGDDVSIAAGIAALVRDNIGDMYRYGPQWGYYRLVQFVTWVLGNEVSTIPAIMLALSSLAGATIPTLALISFRSELGLRERWLLALALVVNPILWVSSRYGNTAVVALAFVIASVVILSNRPGWVQEIVAYILFGAGILIRADAVLLTPFITVLLYAQSRSVRAVVKRIFIFVLTIACTYALIFSLDERVENIPESVSAHLFNGTFRTMFWEYLIWAFSPIPLIFALWGLRDLLITRTAWSIYIVAWCVPVFAFYFGSTTTPRYFLLTVFPICLCSVIGMVKMAEELSTRIGRRIAWGAILAMSCLHMLVGLGHFVPNHVANIYSDAFLMTHDGPMPTGGLVYDSILKDGFLRHSLRNPNLGTLQTKYEPIRRAFREMTIAKTGSRKVIIIVLDGWNGQVIHLYAQEAGAEYLSRGPGPPFAAETWMKLGDVHVMTIGNWYGDDYRSLKQFPVTAGDEVWLLKSELRDTVTAKCPPGLEVMEVPGPGVSAFRFVAHEGPLKGHQG